MSDNSYFSEFKEIYGEMIGLTERLKELTAQAKMDGVDDIPMVKRLARLVAADKLKNEKEKFERLARVADEHGQLSLL